MTLLTSVRSKNAAAVSGGNASILKAFFPPIAGRKAGGENLA
jgi:hypothetical protein